MADRGKRIVLDHGTVSIWHKTEPRTVRSEMLKTGVFSGHNDLQGITVA